MKRDPLHFIVTEFRNGILDKRSSSLMCRAVCLPLQGYLSMIGYETALIIGEIDGGDVDLDHTWLCLPDGQIIDPTADQFSTPERPMPAVYIGEKPEWYKII